MLEWVKRNKLASLIILVLLLLVLKNYFLGIRQSAIPLGGVRNEMAVKSGVATLGMPSILPPSDTFAPSQNKDRLVVEESSMSLVVSDVRKVSDQIVEKAKSLGGYMVNNSLTNPEEAPFAQVTIRVPSEHLKSALDYFRSLSIKVTSENIQGTDVTDEYVDTQARLKTLEQTKAKFEEIMGKASQVQDILTVQRELINIQDQIDSIKGRQQYLEQTAEMAKLTAYLSTDEFSLPYAPSGKFRPEVIFKQAIRSLVNNARDFAGLLIWVVVYAIVWLPILLIIYFIWRRRKLNIS